MALLWAAMSLAALASSTRGVSNKLLFLEASAIARSGNVTLRMAQPFKGRVVVAADRPWESFGVADSTLHALQLEDGSVRIYYGCAELLPGGTPWPPSEAPLDGPPALEPAIIRRVCVAASKDGVTFEKPELGIYTWNGSTANNIVGITPTMPLCGAKPFQPCSTVKLAHECVLGSVWLDSKQGVPASSRFKMSCAVEPNDNTYMFESADGLNFTRMFVGPSINGSDTPVTCMHDDTLRPPQYVCYVRADYFNSFGRAIGRCTAETLDGFTMDSCGCGYGRDCEVAFHADGMDTDIYTNAFTFYEGHYLFFPSLFQHASPYAVGNDGVLDVRLLVSKNGSEAHYTAAANGRAPFVSLGINTCPFSGGLDSLAGLSGKVPTHGANWCDLRSGALGHTAFDASMVWMASGAAISPDGTETLMYHSGNPATHASWYTGGMKTAKDGVGLPNVAIRVLHMRRDGFVFVEAPWVALEGCNGWCNIAELPHVVTTELLMPACALPVATQLMTQNGTAQVCGKDTLDTRIGTGGYNQLTCHTASDCPVSGCFSHPITCNKNENAVGVCGAAGFGDGGMLYERPAQPMLSGGVSVVLNIETATDGFVAVEVQDAQTGVGLKGRSLGDADLLTGNFVAHAASWHNGLTAINGQGGALSKVRLRLALNNAKLFSVQLRCTDNGL
jgi:hypothetical protein